MATDYRNFKTPFYEVKIGDPSGKRMIPLPHHILRLLEKVELTDSLEKDKYNTFNLVFVEGSREPAPSDASGRFRGLYPIDRDIKGSITNRSGALADLRFSGPGGITFLTSQEQSEGRINVNRRANKEPELPTFVFQERNQVQITIGYKENRNLTRTFRGRIIVAKSQFPENDHPTTTIVCTSTEPFLDKQSPCQGVKFAKTIRRGDNRLIDFEDIATTELLRNICNEAGMACIISENLPADKLEKHRSKIQLAGESFKQFLDKLAEHHNAYWRMQPDPETGVDTLIFAKKSDFESKVLINDPELLTYKAPGSIIKSISILADFGDIDGAANVGLNEEGQGDSGKLKTVSAADTGNSKHVLFKPSSKNPDGNKEGIVESDPTKDISAIQKLYQLYQNEEGKIEVSGDVQNSPNDSDPSVSKSKAESRAEKLSRNIQLNMRLIGYPILIPGVYEINGVGVRYSGKYRVMTIKHSLGPDGYVTEAFATSYALPQGGTRPDDAKSGQDVEEQKESFQLFDQRENPKNKDNNIRDEITNFSLKPSGGGGGAGF